MRVDNSDDYFVQTIFLVLITVLCLGVSWWSMFLGYESFVGGYILSAAVASVFVLMLAALNFTLRKGLIKGMGKGGLSAVLALYFIVVLLSFSGMFNKFYSQFMENELIREEIGEKIDALTDIEKRAVTVLTSEEAKAIRANVAALTQELGREIRSQTEPGIGSKARGILREIKELLDINRDFRLYPTPTKSTNELEAVIGLLEQDIESAMQKSDTLRRLNAPEKDELAGLLPNRIRTQIVALTDARGKIGAKTSSETSRANGLVALQSAVDEYKTIGKEVESLVKESTFQYDRNIRVMNERIGEIPHTFESAREHLDRGVVWVAAGIALGIDLVVPLFVFFLTPRSGVATTRRNNRGPSSLRAQY